MNKTLLFSFLTTFMGLFSLNCFAQTTVSIGEGTYIANSHLPIEAYYKYSYSQSLYLSSEINMINGGQISKISWYFAGTSLLPNAQNITIYMANTTKTSFTGSTDWINGSDMTAVYTGPIPVTGPGWIELTLDSPFAYNGTSNLVVAVDENFNDNNAYDNNSDEFYNTAVEDVRSIFYYSDSTNPDPFSPPTASGTSGYVPNVKFTITETELDYCVPSYSTGCGSGDYIDDFIIEDAGINHLASGCSNGAYGDFTEDETLVGNFTIGDNYDFSSTHAYSNQFMKIYIDFNKNGSFEDEGELVYASTSGSLNTTGNFTIPISALPTTTRMRVMNRYSAVSPSSCVGGVYGEAHDYKVVLQYPEETPCTEFIAVDVTGFNADVIAEGSGEANVLTSVQIDGTYFANALYSADFVPTTPHTSGASAAVVGGGLPVDGLISSATTTGLSFQLANYSENNALLLRNSFNNTGTLTFTTAQKAKKIYVPMFSAEGTNYFSVVVNFEDGSSQTFNANTATDWVQNSAAANNVVYGLGRVSRGGTNSSLNQFSEVGKTGIYQKEFSLSFANQYKNIVSITFNQTPPTGAYTTTTIFGVSICPTEEDLGVDQVSNVNSELAVFPNPTKDYLYFEKEQLVKEWQVYSLNGQKMIQSNAKKLNLSGLSAGIYVVRVALIDGQIITKKVIKK